MYLQNLNIIVNKLIIGERNNTPPGYFVIFPNKVNCTPIVKLLLTIEVQLNVKNDWFFA